MPGEVREAMSEALKHLTASSQKNRNSLVALQVLPLIIAQLTTGELHNAPPLCKHYLLRGLCLMSLQTPDTKPRQCLMHTLQACCDLTRSVQLHSAWS